MPNFRSQRYEQHPLIDDPQLVILAGQSASSKTIDWDTATQSYIQKDGALYLGGYAPAGFVLPANWTPADILFEGSIDGLTFFKLQDPDELRYRIRASNLAPGAMVPGRNFDWRPILYLRLLSATGEDNALVAVNQVNEQRITVICRPDGVGQR